MSRVRKFPVEEILLDERCQARADVNHDAVTEYRSAYEAGVELPPLRIFMVSGKAYLVDGFHRLPAAMNAGKSWVRCEVVGEGTIDEAIWTASAVNQAHGVRRTNADKRRAVKLALRTDIGMEQSSRAIAEHVGVSHVFVEKVRDEIEAEHSARLETVTSTSEKEEARLETVTSRATKTRIGRDGRRRPAKSPAKKPEEQKAEQSEVAANISEPSRSDEVLPAYGAELANIGNVLRESRLWVMRADLPKPLAIRLAEAIQAAESIAAFSAPEICPACAGARCAKCRDAGWVMRSDAEQIRASSNRKKGHVA